MLPKLKMQGRSGCKLQVFMGSDSVPFVRKYSSAISYNARLMKQAEKQQFFSNNVLSGSFFSPNVYDQFAQTSDLSWFDMEFVAGEKYSDIFERITTPEIERMIKAFEAYFEQALQVSTFQHPDKKIIEEKVLSLEKSLQFQHHLDLDLVRQTLDFLRNEIPTEPLALGFCHGDFTLSNILFYSPEKMYLLDFLDSFIESPLVDMVKLRQDTKFRWSLMLEGGELPQYKVNKVTQLLRYFDERMHEYFLQYPFYVAWYKYMERFNLMRILPYVEQEHEIAFVQNCLRDQNF